MNIKLCLNMFKYHDTPCKPLLYLYNISELSLYFYWYHWNNVFDSIGVYFSISDSANELSPFQKKELKRIMDFYEVLKRISWTETHNAGKENWMLMDVVEYDKEERIKEAKRLWEESWGKIEKILLEWYGNWLEQWAYGIVYDFMDDKIMYWYEDMDMPEDDKIEWELTRPEFNLLMQIYYGVYDDERLKRELEEKEKKWEYKEMLEEVKRLEEEKQGGNNCEDENYKRKCESFYKKYKDKWEEYLKLQLMRKDTTWAFPELKIRKIYDANWSEEEQRRVIEKINKELGKEVVILE